MVSRSFDTLGLMCLFMSNESQDVPCLSDYPIKFLYTFFMTSNPDTFPPQMPTDLECKKTAITSTDFLRVIRKSPLYKGWNFIMATIYLQLIQNRYMFRSFTVLQCSHQHCVQPVASDVEVVGYL